MDGIKSKNARQRSGTNSNFENIYELIENVCEYEIGGRSNEKSSLKR